MRLLNTASLGRTLDNISDILFHGNNVHSEEAKRAAAWIASRQGLPGSYAGMFAPTAGDYRSGVRVFTGEKITSGAATGHILGEETIRTLRLLCVKDAKVTRALDSAMRSFKERLGATAAAGYPTGTYCCGICSAAYWRALVTGWLADSERRIAGGLRDLKRMRLDNGSWRRYPFHYTCLALTEIGPELARAEMEYAAGRCERLAKKVQQREGLYEARRVAVAERLLAAV